MNQKLWKNIGISHNQQRVYNHDETRKDQNLGNIKIMNRQKEYCEKMSEIMQNNQDYQDCVFIKQQSLASFQKKQNEKDKKFVQILNERRDQNTAIKQDCKISGNQIDNMKIKGERILKLLKFLHNFLIDMKIFILDYTKYFHSSINHFRSFMTQLTNNVPVATSLNQLLLEIKKYKLKQKINQSQITRLQNQNQKLYQMIKIIKQNQQKQKQVLKSEIDKIRSKNSNLEQDIVQIRKKAIFYANKSTSSIKKLEQLSHLTQQINNQQSNNVINQSKSKYLLQTPIQPNNHDCYNLSYPKYLCAQSKNRPENTQPYSSPMINSLSSSDLRNIQEDINRVKYQILQQILELDKNKN